MDHITAGGILFCVALLWAFTGLVLWQVLQLRREVEKLSEQVMNLEEIERLDTADIDELFEQITDLEKDIGTLEVYQKIMIKRLESENLK